MEKIKIHNREVLQYQLQLLQARERELRAKITDDAGIVLQAVTDPSVIIKSTIKKLAEDQEVRSDLLNLAVGWVSNYIHDLFKKPGPVGEFFKKILGKFRGTDGDAGI